MPVAACLRAPLVMLLAYAAAVAPASAQRELNVRGQPTCPGCTILLETVATLGRPDDPALVQFGTSVAMDSQGRFIAAGTYLPGVLVMYDSTGAYLRMFGRQGGGPGEFGAGLLGLHLGMTASDTLHVYERGRHSVVAPGLAGFVRSHPRPAAGMSPTALPGGRSIMSLRRREHAFLLVNAAGEELQRFGSPMGDGGWHAIRRSADGARFWSSHRHAYRVDRWRTDGTLEIIVRRHADWFRARGDGPLARPHVIAAAEDDAGHLWILVRVPKADAPELVGEVPLGEFDLSTFYESVLEVVELSTGRLLATRSFPFSLYIAAATDGFPLTLSRQLDSGIVVIDVLRPRLIRR